MMISVNFSLWLSGVNFGFAILDMVMGHPIFAMLNFFVSAFNYSFWNKYNNEIAQ